MKKLIVFLFSTVVILMYIIFTVFFFFSCKEKVGESVQILIQNRTEDIIHVSLFPKYENIRRDTEYTLNPNNDGKFKWEEIILYSSKDFNLEPHTIVSQVFDSILICFTNIDNIKIKFTHESVTGYLENIFSKDSTWDYREIEWDESDFKVRKAIRHTYFFGIFDNKIIIE